MSNSIESMSYVTYQYDVYPRVVEKHSSSNITSIPIYGADIKIFKKFIKLNNNTMKYIINISNDGDKEAKDLKIMVILTNLDFIKHSIFVNDFNVKNYDFNNGFFIKSILAKENITISFNVKLKDTCDNGGLVSGFYYFISKDNKKIYRSVTSNLSTITNDYSDILIDIKKDNIPVKLNCKKEFNVFIKNIGNITAENVKFNILTPNELKLDYESFFLDGKKIKSIDDYAFPIENLEPNCSKNINFKLSFVLFKSRTSVPIVLYCNFSNVSSDGTYNLIDSKLYRSIVNLR